MLLRKKIIKKISLIYALLPKVKSIWGGGGKGIILYMCSWKKINRMFGNFQKYYESSSDL